MFIDSILISREDAKKICELLIEYHNDKSTPMEKKTELSEMIDMLYIEIVTSVQGR